MVEKGIKLKLGRRDAVRLPLRKFWLYAVMTALAVVMTLPLIYAVGTAFKPLDELLRFPPIFFVRRPTFDNFSDLFLALDSSSVPFLRYLFNSVLVTGVATAGTILVSTLGGYAMSKLTVPGSSVLFTLVIIAMTFPGSVTTIPVYMIINRLGLYNTYAALILPRVATAYGMFLMKQFCDQLPKPILEAARVDGAHELQIYSGIALPFLRPAWGTLLVFTFTSCWNDAASSLMYTANQNLRLLPVMLSSISESGSLARAGAAAAASFLIMLPSIVIFILQQRKVMETIAHSGIK